MKLAVFEWKGARHIGVVSESDDTVTRLDIASDAVAEAGVTALIGRDLPATAEVLALSDVSLLAPVPRPRRNIFCVGKNYFDHAHEFASSGFDSSAAKGAIPEAPIIFSKVPECVVRTGDPIRIDASVSTAIDYEAELAVIIGKGGRNIAPEAALSHVWG